MTPISFKKLTKNAEITYFRWWGLYVHTYKNYKKFYWETARMFPGIDEVNKVIEKITEYFPKSVIRRMYKGNKRYGSYSLVLVLNEEQSAMMMLFMDQIYPY